MRHFTTILGHELRMLLVNPSTYVAALLFLVVMGFTFTGIIDTYSGKPYEIPPSEVFFQFFFVPVLFMVPLLTMKCLAEERRLGTIETLLTTPVSTVEVVLGKFGAIYILYMGLWFSTAGYFYILHRFSGDTHFLDSGPLIGGYLFIAVSGLMFIAIGVFASSLSRSQAVAGIICFTLLLALILGLKFLVDMPVLQTESMRGIKSAVEYAQVFDHLDDFIRGIIDTRHILFYLSGTALALIFSILSVEAKVLHS